MAYHGRRAVSAELEDTIYTCRQCGAELVRTSIRKASTPGAEAA
jgi:hypothetical protein